VDKIEVKLSGFSKSFRNARQLLTEISQIKAEQAKRQQRLSSSSAMNSYAKSKGISTAEMSSLTKSNFSENQKNLKKLENIASTKDFKKRLELERGKAKSLFSKSRDLSGGGKAAAAIDSQRGGVSKSLLAKKIMPKT